MNIQIKKHRAQCALYAYAMVIDIPAMALAKLLGHDGTQILWSDLPEPKCYRGFHSSEFSCALLKLGYSCVTFVKRTGLGHDAEHLIKIDNEIMINELKDHYNGVIYTRGHAYAWVEGKVIDPDNGKKTDWSNHLMQRLIKFIVIIRV